MKIESTYRYFCPLSLMDVFGTDRPSLEDLSAVNSTCIIFRIESNYDLVPLFNSLDKNYKPWYSYICESCLCHTNERYSTRLFDGSKDLPYEVEKEMQQHCKDHQRYGTWGIRLWKESRKNIESKKK